MATHSQYIHDLTRPQLEALLDRYQLPYISSDPMDSLRKLAKEHIETHDLPLSLLPTVEQLEREVQRKMQATFTQQAATKPTQPPSSEAELATFLKSLQLTQNKENWRRTEGTNSNLFRLRGQINF